MHLMQRPGARVRVARGFSLLEAVIAAAIVLLTVAAVTMAVTAASRASARVTAVAAADAAVQAEVARLRLLPFCAPSYPALTRAAFLSGARSTDLVGEVFPHADAAANVTGAAFAGAGTAAGTFTTTLTRPGASVTCIASFLDSTGRVLEAPALESWALWSSVGPPAARLRVEVRAQALGVTRTCSFVRGALRVSGPLVQGSGAG